MKKLTGQSESVGDDTVRHDYRSSSCWLFALSGDIQQVSIVFGVGVHVQKGDVAK